MSWLILALLVAVAVAAWALALGRWTVAPWPHLRPLAWLATLGAAADGAVMQVRWLVLDGEPKPYEGAARLAYHATQGIVLAWPAALVAVARVAFLRRRWRLVVPVWVVALAGVAWAYPWLRLERLGVAYAVWSWACCGIVAVIAGWTYRRVDWGPHHVAPLLLMAGETIAAFAYLDVQAWERWDGPRAAHGMALGLLLVYLVRQVCRYCAK